MLRYQSPAIFLLSNTSVIFIWSALILCFSFVLFLFWRMILHRNGHGHGSGKSYHKTSFFVCFRCLHWVNIQYLDTYFGSLFSFSGWLGVSERFRQRAHTVIYHCPAFLCTQRFGFVCFYLVSLLYHELMIYTFVISFIVTR